MEGETVDSLASAETLGSPSGAPLPELPTVAVESYVQLDEYARGGLGRIIRAKDQRTGRTVAIKEMLAANADAAARFVREAMVTANLQHPAIVPVYEVGQWPDGKPFYAMKLVQGRALNDAIAQATDLDGRLALIAHVAAVADALAYAHGERVIHRDLKPHNVLCGAFGETVVIDWGLARRLDETDAAAPLANEPAPGETSIGAIMGTPSYMAPEQARGDRADERTDVYAIGAILYHVLAGRPPHVGRDIDTLLQQVRTTAPPPLSPSVPPDLRAIAERALARDAAARYPSAAELASDLRRFMTGQLVLAHHYTRRERFARFVRRHRAVLAVALAAFVIVAVGATIAIRNIVVARGEATTSRDEARRRLVGSYVDRAGVELVGGHADRALAYAIASGEQATLTPEARLMAGVALDQLPAIRTWSGSGVVEFVPGSHEVVIGGKDLVRWDPETNQVRWRLPDVGTRDVRVIGGDMFALASNAGVTFAALADGKSVDVVSPPQAQYTGLLGSDSNGRWLAAPTRTRIDLFEVSSRKLVASIPFEGAHRALKVSPDGEHLIVSQAQAMSIIDRAGQVVATLGAESGHVEPAGDEVVYARPLAPNGIAQLVVADWTGKARLELPIGISAVRTFAVDAKHEKIALCTVDGGVQVRSVASGQVLWQTSVEDQVTAIRFDGDVLRVLGTSVGVIGFDVASGIEVERVLRPGFSMVSSDDHSRVAVLTLDSVMLVVPARTCIPLAPTPASVTDLVLLPNGNVITAGQDGDLHELRDGRVIRKLATGGGAIATLARLDDGTLITASEEGAVIVRDAEGRELHRHAGTRGVPSPDGRLLAVGTLDGNVEVWEIASGTRIRTLGNVAGAMSSIRWSSDGKRIAGSTELGHVMVWTVEGALVRNIDRAKAGGGPIAFSPDGKWLVRAGEPADTLFSLDDGADRRLPGVPDAALVVGFSPHHESMLLAGVGYVATWDVTTNQNRLRIATNNWITGAAFLAEDRYLIGGSIDRRVHVWDAETGAELLAFIAPAPVRRIVVDNKRVAVLTTRGALIWNVPGFEGTLDDLRALARCRIDIEIHDAHARTRAIDVAACNSHGR